MSDTVSLSIPNLSNSQPLMLLSMLVCLHFELSNRLHMYAGLSVNLLNLYIQYVNLVELLYSVVRFNTEDFDMGKSRSPAIFLKQ